MKIVDILFLAAFPSVNGLRLGRSPVVQADGGANSSNRSPGRNRSPDSISIEIPESPIAYADQSGHIELGMRNRFSPTANSATAIDPDGSSKVHPIHSRASVATVENDGGAIRTTLQVYPPKSLHIMKFVSMLIPCLNNYLITLNVYNGDLFGHYIKGVAIPEDIEYMLWFAIPFVANVLFDLVYVATDGERSYANVPLLLRKLYISCYFVWIIGIGTNLYWHYFSPWKIDPPPHRHRTEYYDSRALLAGMTYTHLLLFEENINVVFTSSHAVD